MPPPVSTRMTADEYSQLPETTQPMALIDGELIMSPSPVPKHQQTSMKLIALLLALIEQGELFSAPMDVRFDEVNVTQPDILWIKPDGRCVVGETQLQGPPDLIVEILSPGSVRDDKIKKFKLYQRFSVPEYWIVDPIETYVEVYVATDGEYRLQGIYPPDAIFESAALGKSVDLSRVFER